MQQWVGHARNVVPTITPLSGENAVGHQYKRHPHGNSHAHCKIRHYQLAEYNSWPNIQITA